jgi:ubiquinone/menaquinone biosynthesis C-methylase UbiE
MVELATKINDDDGKPVCVTASKHMVPDRRVETLSQHLMNFLPSSGSVLDFGCGDGAIASRVMQLLPDVTIEGTDIQSHPAAQIPVTRFEGQELPFKTDSFDYVAMVDVLHLLTDPVAVLGEAARVARHGVVAKGHVSKGMLDGPIRNFLDRMGGDKRVLRMKNKYRSKLQWAGVFNDADCDIAVWQSDISISRSPISWLSRQTEFIALLVPNSV